MQEQNASCFAIGSLNLQSFWVYLWDGVDLLLLSTKQPELPQEQLLSRVWLKTPKRALTMTSIFHFETLTLQPSYLTHCWVLQPMAEPEPCMPHRVNHVWSGCMVLHHEHELCTQNALVLWQTAVALFLHTCKVSCRVWIVSAHMFFGSPSLTSGVRWPAWSRATAASLSSAPPPPHPANHSPARWSPGRNWKPRTSVPTIPPPSYALTF